ncbi:MAG: antibiotic resistance protein [Firmicutes bacterium]|nr:antibiotic resistance protein [Bacillota bacterium]
MQQIRYKQRICTDQAKIEALLVRARTGVVGMVEAGRPYTVPVNFIWYNGSVYFHGMGSGKKESILREAPPVCFTVYEEHGTVTDPVPCHADTAYLSIMIFGTAKKVTDFAEAAAALQQILDKYTPGHYSQTLSGSLIEKYRSAHDNNAVAVYRIESQEMTAKENAADV